MTTLIQRGRLSCNMHDKPFGEFVSDEFARYSKAGFVFKSVVVPISCRDEVAELPIPVFGERECPALHVFFVEE